MDVMCISLILRAKTGGGASRIAEFIGISPTRPTDALLEGDPRAFFLDSCKVLNESKALQEHMRWLRSTCGEGLPKIGELLSSGDYEGKVFVYINSDDDVIYVEMKPDLFLPFMLEGLQVEVKVEFDAELDSEMNSLRDGDR